MEDLLKKIEALEKRVSALESARAGRKPLTWRQKANIYYDKHLDLTVKQVAQKHGVSVPIVYKIFGDENPAEVEYKKITGMSAFSHDTIFNTDDFIKWRNENL